MLAKVLKHPEPGSFVLFPVPEIGEANATPKGLTNFIVPVLSETRFFDSPKFAEQSFSEPILPEDILQNARDEAARIIARAEENRALIEAAAREKALLEAESNFDAAVNAKVETIRLELAATLEHLAALAVEISSSAESELVELAVRIAKKIVSREVTIDREIALKLVKASLAKLHNRSVAEVHLNSEDYAFIESNRENLEFRGVLQLVDDRSISPGGCLIHTETGDIDARIESQFDEILYGLLN